MSGIKYRIPFGNCENDLNSDILDQTVSEGLWTADSIIITADNNTATADGFTG